MNGAADMGGMHGFGPVVPEPDEPVFHAGWEKRAFALNLAIGIADIWTLDAFRGARESLPPAQYLNLSYYGLWVVTTENMMIDYGLTTAEELKAGRPLAPGRTARRKIGAADVAAMVRCGSPYNRPAPAPARFKAGDAVRAKNINPPGHTRLPRYARGRAGEIVRIVGCHVFPDSNAVGRGEDPHWLYTVRFSGQELWGEDTDPMVKVHIEAWEPYLEPA